MKRDLRNCRCCMATYEKPTNFYCVLPLVDDDGKMVEPVGFCEFCDKNNKVWYLPNKKCHNDPIMMTDCICCKSRFTEPSKEAPKTHRKCNSCGALFGVVR